MKMGIVLLVISTLTCFIVSGEGTGLPKVKKIEVNSGSCGGGQKLRIFGENFSKDPYTYGTGNEDKGNQVIFTDGESDMVLETFVEDSIKSDMIVAWTKRMEPGRTYQLRVKVNGEDIPPERLCPDDPELCSFKASWHYTPLIESLEPWTGIPGEDFVLKLTGNIMTDRIGSDNYCAPNGVCEKITRAWAPGQCLLRDPDDKPYGIEVAEDSYAGSIRCHPNETFIGNRNISVMYEGRYGRSMTDRNQFRISADNMLYSFQTYADASLVSNHDISTEGALLRIEGQYYEKGGSKHAKDSTYKPLWVRTGVPGVECVVKEVVKDEYVECMVGKMPDVLPAYFPGGRGINVKRWSDGTFGSIDDLVDATPPTDGFVHFDMTRFCGSDIGAYQTRADGMLIPTKSGTYEFQLKSDYPAKLYFEGAFETESSGGQWRSGQRLDLTENQYYQVSIVAMGQLSNPAVSAEDSCIEARLLYFNEKKFTNAWTGNAIDDMQIFRYSSTPTQDVQKLKFSGYQSQTEKTEVQTVCVEGGSYLVSLGLFGTWTEMIGIDTASTVEEALNNMPLPILDDGAKFSVEQPDGSDQCARITFPRPGDFEPFQVRGQDLDSYTVTEDKGTPDKEVAIVMNGRPSIPIDITNLDQATVQAAVDSLFEARCPPQITDGTFQDFENIVPAYGSVVNEVEAYCGKKSLMNPSRIFPWTADQDPLSLLMQSKAYYICFAYSGMQWNATLKFKYRAPGEDRDSVSSIILEPLQNQTERNPWSYACADIFPKTGKGELIWAKLEGKHNEKFYVDAVSLRKKPPYSEAGNLDEHRLPPASPNPDEQVLIDHSEVTYDEVTDEYTVQLFPLHCGSDFSLFELMNKQEPDPLTGDQGVTHLKGSNVQLSVSRSEHASPAVRGTFGVQWNGHTKNIHVDLSNMTTVVSNMKRILEGIPNIGNLEVKMSDGSTCANADAQVTFRTRPGDQVLFEIDETKKSLTAPPSADVEIVNGVDGHSRYDPIIGDLIFELHDKPQAIPYINNIPTYCRDDCSFQWSAVATPYIDSLDKTEGFPNDLLLISGGKFSATAAENTVTIGDTECITTESADTYIRCKIGNGRGVDLPVIVHVAGLGIARNNDPAALFSYDLSITDFEPKEGSYGGSQKITIFGNGFYDGVKVYIDGSECLLVDRTTTEMMILTPEILADDLSANKEMVLEVHLPVKRRKRAAGGVKTAGSKFVAKGSATGKIENVVFPAEPSVAGGEEMQVTGTNFGDSPVVYVGQKLVDIIEKTDNGGKTTLRFGTPPLVPEVETPVRVDNGNGAAVDKTSKKVPKITGRLKVKNLEPKSGSLFGGTLLTIDGKGFGTVKEKLEVTVGGYECVVKEVTPTRILCQVAKMCDTVRVTNDGTGQAHDMYFAFDQKDVEISECDTIEWTWKTAFYVQDTLHGIYQTVSETNTTKVMGGVDSGVPTRSGKFEYTFYEVTAADKPIYIWSGMVQTFRDYSQQVSVKSKESAANPLVVKLSGQEAKYQTTGSSRKRRAQPAQSCSTDPTIPDNQRFYFINSKCGLSEITKLKFDPASREPGYSRGIITDTEITVEGSHLPTDTNNLEVTLEDCSCVVLPSPAPSSSKFVCQPDPDCTLPSVGLKKELTVNVIDFGFVRNKLSQNKLEFFFLPSIQGMTPEIGSTAGSTPVTITGTGLQNITSVRFSNIECWALNIIDDRKMECLTPKTSTGPVTASVGNSYPSSCDIGSSNSKCFFTYSPGSTPKVSSASPATIDTTNPSTVTLTGEKFGTNSAEVTVAIGGEECSVTSLTGENTIECTINGLPAGKNLVDARIAGLGKASTTSEVTGVEVVDNPVTPSEGSIHGGMVLTITGHGFHREGTSVTVDGNTCEIQGEVTLSQILCIIPPHSSGTVQVQVAVHGDALNFPARNFTYSETLTITDISPVTGGAGDSVTVTGSGFGTDENLLSLDFDGATCAVQAGVSDTTLTCVLGSHILGAVAVVVNKMDYGLSNTLTSGFTYVPQLDSIHPASGNKQGGQELTLIGSGFPDDMEVTVCGEPCRLDEFSNQTMTALVCITPPGTDGGSCDVSIVEPTQTLPAAYSYTSGGIPIVTGITPDRVGTGGGTKITITGQGFGTDPADISVLIEGQSCDIDVVSLSDTNIECTVPPKTWIKDDVKPVVSKRETTGGRRKKRNVNTTYWYKRAVGVPSLSYIDQWSSKWTWGGRDPPGTGELVVIPHGQTILLDQDTDVLEMLVVNGGKFIFDSSKERIELKAKYILIIGDGLLQIGTEEVPYLNRAIITMYGHHRMPQLPVYGAKGIAIRHGLLDIHGEPYEHTWTRLSESALAGATSIVVPTDHVADWPDSAEVAIATTGGRSSQRETERCNYTSKTDNGDGTTTLQLEEQLEYFHAGITETYDGGKWSMDYRAEVGLLSRTILFRGTECEGWPTDTIEMCEEGFDPGQHAIQTCFQGRWGEETGSCGYGAHIMAHTPNTDSNEARMRIEYMAFQHVGQEFQLGRYAMHSHVNGDMSASYLIGNVVDKSFNRAVNIHATSNLEVKWNMAYEVMGGTFFTEDGVEVYNIITDNLCMNTMSSPSLQNDDLNAACFWITNPNNIYRRNAAVGASHMGYWFRMNEFPDGPSFTTSVHPRTVCGGIFEDNTCHSCGEIGLWIFQEWTPMKDDTWPPTVANSQPAILNGTEIWNCRKGIETVDIGSVPIINSKLSSNFESNYEGVKQIKTERSFEKGTGIRNSLLVGHPNAPELNQYTTRHAMVAPFGAGYYVDDVTVSNFDTEDSAILHFAIQGLCPDLCGGYNISVSNLQLDNSAQAGRVFARWSFEGVIDDLDGSLSGSADSTVTQANPTLPDSCTEDDSLKAKGSVVSVVKCPADVKLLRFAFNDVQPASLFGQTINFANRFGSTSVYHRKKRFTHKPGLMGMLVDRETTTIGYAEDPNAVIPPGGGTLLEYQALTNFSFSGMISLLTEGSGVILRLPAIERPDRVSINDVVYESLPRDNDTGLWPQTIDINTAQHGDWLYADDGFVNVAIKGPSDSPGDHEGDYVMNRFSFYKCQYTGCIYPVPALLQPPTVPRPEWARDLIGENGWMISQDDENTWVSAGPYQAGDEDSYPMDGSDVIVSEGDWIMVTQNSVNMFQAQSRKKRSTSCPTGSICFRNMLVYGDLEVADEADYDIRLDSMVISGSLHVGTEDKLFQHSFTLTIHGNKLSPSFENPDWIHGIVGPKALASYRGIDFHGKDVGVSWTKLALTANAGDTTIEVQDDVTSWGDVVSGRDIEIIVTTTSNKWSDTERGVIQSVSGTTITLRDPLQYRHISTTEDVDGKTYEFRAAAGLLTRNILIQGDDGESAPMFGPRLLCSIMQELEEKNGEMVPGDVNQCYMRMTNTEMRFMGQEGFESDTDYRAAVSILNADNTTTRPIYIRNSAFHDLYAGAIAVVGSKDIEISDIVVHNNVGPAFYASAEGTVLKYSLFSMALFSGTYNGRYEKHNFNWPAAVDLLGAEEYILEGNYVVGSERIAYLQAGDECDAFTTYNEATANWAVSNLRGINIFADVTLPAREGNCRSFSNMKFWKNEVASYYQNNDDVLFTNNVYADHKTGLWALLIGPSAANHVYEDKVVNITDSIFLGYLSETDCADDASEEWLSDNEPAYKISGADNIDCRGVTGPSGERLSGIVFPACDEGSNKAPGKPCYFTQATNCMGGRTEVSGVRFKNFGEHGSCLRSYAIAGNPDNDDLQTPITVRDTIMVDRANGWEENLVYAPRPNVQKINAGDCVDLDCDAKGKCFHLQDADGTFFGTPGTPGAVVPDAGFMWEGTWPGEVDKRHGAGDYRIPATALLDYLTGEYIPPRDVCQIIGIPGTNEDRCTRINTPIYNDGDGQYNAYRCTGIKHKMVAFESQDHDAKSRRLSPVLVQQKVDSIPYCYILNGPQDHGCCSGYNCLKRQSLFHGLIAMTGVDALALIYLTSTTPDKMRFVFVNPDEDSCVVIGVYHTKPNRPDIYIENDDGSTTRVTPVNGRFVQDGNTERFILDYVANEDVEATRPTCANTYPAGSNFIHRDARIVYFALRQEKILMILSEQIIVSYFLPTVTEGEFFKSEVILGNLASLLNVLPNMVRIVKAVASADGTRRRRSTGQQEGITITLEIGNQPTTSADQVSNADATELGSIVMRTCQDQTIGSALAVETECEQIIIGDTEYNPIVPASMGFELQLTQRYEGGVFAVQPKVRAYNSTGSPIVDLGIKEDPWELTATIKSGTGDADAVLGGMTTITSTEGWFNFTDLFITHAGSGYILQFDITKPSSAADLNLTIESAAFDVDVVPMTAGLYAITSDDILEGVDFSITLELRNKLTNQPIEDITWRGHTFDVDCRLPDYNDVSTLSGNGSRTFDTSNGRAPLEGLSLSGFGLNVLECHVNSTPPEFDFYFYQRIYVLGTSQVGIPRETSNIHTVRMQGDYASLTDSELAQLEQMVIQDISKKHPDVIITDSSTAAGSILITFTVEGALLNVTTLSTDLCTSIKEGQSYTIGSTTYTLDQYMTVDGQDYYGTNCGAAAESESGGLHLGYIILIVVLGVLIVATIVVILLWKFKVIPKTKTHEIRNTRFQPEEESGPSEKYSQIGIVEPSDSERYRDNGKLVYLGRGLPHEGTFTSLGGSTLYSSHINVDMRNTPSPAPISTGTPAPESDAKHPIPNPLLVPPTVTKTKGSRLDVSPVPDNKIWKY